MELQLPQLRRPAPGQATWVTPPTVCGVTRQIGGRCPPYAAMSHIRVPNTTPRTSLQYKMQKLGITRQH